MALDRAALAPGRAVTEDQGSSSPVAAIEALRAPRRNRLLPDAHLDHLGRRGARGQITQVESHRCRCRRR
jgi:hypothetical protein